MCTTCSARFSIFLPKYPHRFENILNLDNADYFLSLSELSKFCCHQTGEIKLLTADKSKEGFGNTEHLLI